MNKHIHNIEQKKIDNIKLQDADVVEHMAALFKMFGDNTRLNIMEVLLETSLNVCEIAYLLNMTHSAISHQLAILKMNGLVKSLKKGKEVYYSLADDHIVKILNIGKEHVEEEENER